MSVLNAVSPTDSNYYDSINITGENLDTILDCPEEEEYESQKKYGKMFLNSSYSHSRRGEKGPNNRQIPKRGPISTGSSTSTSPKTRASVDFS